MTPLDWLAATLVVSLGSLLQGSVGFGLGMLAAPLLVLLEPSLIPGPLLMAALLLTFLVARRERQSIDFHGVGWAIFGRLPGTALGAATMLVVSERATALMVGVVVFVAVAIVGAGKRLERTRPVLFGAGVLSGFMGTTTSIGGPPVAVLYQDAGGAKMRGTLSSYFVLGLVVSLTGLALVGRFGLAGVRSAVMLMPGVLIGFLVSNHLAPVLDRGHTRRSVLIVSALAGLSVIVRTLAS